MTQKKVPSTAGPFGEKNNNHSLIHIRRRGDGIFLLNKKSLAIKHEGELSHDKTSIY
jgi:hypothetical protein